MATVKNATYDLLRKHGITTIFGNPGSTELPMLADFPDDIKEVAERYPEMQPKGKA